MQLYNNTKPNIEPAGGNNYDGTASFLNGIATLILIAGIISGFIAWFIGGMGYGDAGAVMGFLSAIEVWIPTFGFFAIPKGLSAIIYKLEKIQTQSYIINNINSGVNLRQNSDTSANINNLGTGNLEKAYENNDNDCYANKGDSYVSKVIDNSLGKTVEYDKRPSESITCSVCGAKQSSDRNQCFSCGAEFIFKNEQNDKRSVNKKKIYVCSGCGKRYNEKVNFCAVCGKAVEEKYI